MTRIRKRFHLGNISSSIATAFTTLFDIDFRVYSHNYRAVSRCIHESALCLLEKRGVTPFLWVFDYPLCVRCLSDDQRFSAAIIPLITLLRREFWCPSSFHNRRCNSRRIVSQSGYRCPKFAWLIAAAWKRVTQNPLTSSSSSRFSSSRGREYREETCSGARKKFIWFNQMVKYMNNPEI